MSIEVSVYCDNNYYGDDCSVFCLDTDSCEGHYTCDPDTGAKDCLTYWEGDDCLDRIDGSPMCPEGGLVPVGKYPITLHAYKKTRL